MLSLCWVQASNVTKDHSMWGQLYKFVVAKPKGVKPTFQTATKQLLSKPTHLKLFDHHVQVLGVIFILCSHVHVNILQPHEMLPSEMFFSTVSTFITGGAKTKNKPAVPALPPAALAMYAFGLSHLHPQDTLRIVKTKTAKSSYEPHELQCAQQGLVNVLQQADQ
ncbi:hypothetical protein FRC11_011607 [Ceratobasidium sp. 423]|nr:hypothetical protein FRC11_011607 [Ceratobasidium sp. 423]